MGDSKNGKSKTRQLNRGRNYSPAEKLAIEQRREKVSANLLAGMNYREIATALDVSIGTIANDVKVMLNRWQKAQIVETEKVITLNLRRLDVLINTLWPQVQGPKASLFAIDRFLKVLDRQAKYLGLDNLNLSVEWVKEAQEKGLNPNELKEQLVAQIMAQLEAKDNQNDEPSASGDEVQDSETS